MSEESGGYDIPVEPDMADLLGNDSLNTLKEAVEKNAELYRAAGESLNRLTVIYELTKSILSMNDLDELLRKITEEVAKLFNATGSMIRLIEDEKLKIKASYGIPEDIIGALTVSIQELHRYGKGREPFRPALQAHPGRVRGRT